MASSSAFQGRNLCGTEVGVLPDDFYIGKLSDVSKSRKPSPIWDLFSVESQPGIISMLAGKPNPKTFPFEHLSLAIKTSHSPTHNEVTELTLRDEDLTTALQYNLTSGIPELVEWVRGLMDEVHLGVAGEGDRDSSWRVSLGHGSQDLLYKAFCALLNPGDTIIIEGPTYPTIIPVLDSLQCNYAIIDSDEDGMNASSLQNVLTSWHTDPSTSDKPFPKVLYTVPFGSNPAGVTTSLPRRLEILRLARKFDLIILEDDPYYFLYYGDAPRQASYFTLDRLGSTASGAGLPRTEPVANVADEPWEVDMRTGRVLRMDSFSKIISAGFRLGWVTGPNVLVKAIENHNASTVVQPSSLSQMVVLKLLQNWGREGFLAHTQHIATFYRQRRDVMAKSLDRHFVNMRGNLFTPDDDESQRPKAEWIVPDASMFFWVKLHLPLPELDITTFVRNIAVPRGILVLPGSAAFPEERQTGCVRLSFSLLTDEEAEVGVKRLAEAVTSLSKSTVEEGFGNGGPAAASGTVMGATRSRSVCMLEGAVREEVEELVLYPRALTGSDLDVKPLQPLPSSFSDNSSESDSTAHKLSTPATPSLADKYQSPSGQSPQPGGISTSSIVFPRSAQGRSQMDPHPHRFTARLRRVSSTIGLKFKSLARSPSTARLTEGVLKIRTSVMGLRENARMRGASEVT